MINFIGKKIFGSRNARVLKRMQPLVDQINAFEPGVRALSDALLQAKTSYFKELLSKGKTVNDILPEAFAVVREASCRTLKMRHFDVQLLGGIVLHEGKIAEMKTGEGKTLVATLPIYLNALTGQGAHVVTVNDYLAKRDANWMGEIYKFLGLSVGIIVHGLNDTERKAAYSCDVTYGTNNEFGFDYLRDNMKFSLLNYTQRDFHFAIVDEVDSILIDEARTPLIISGPTDETTDKYYRVNTAVIGLKKDVDYTLEEKSKSANLTEEGMSNVEKRLGVENLYAPENMELLHHVHQALKAHMCFKKDVDYVVQEDEVIIVDEFTGRLMPGRRYSDSLHQALETKENVTIEKENQTLATITFQNFFRMYKKLAGMTGTADTEAEEFQKIYNLEVIVIPPNKQMIRKDYPDLIYKTAREKFKAVVNEIKELNKESRPVLVGTISIEKSELLSKLLTREGIKHHVLNAKQHEKEAEIVAQAGQPYAVTISTNMAGRGTDIVLGEGIAAKGGLHILGTERHESRRIDNQLRGRAGRQGDMGSSRFYLSLEDDLLRIFGSERIANFMNRLGMEDDIPIEHSFISKAIENAQRKVEGHNFDIRKHLLKYDDVMSKQRQIIYGKRREVLEGLTIKENTREWIEELASDIVSFNLDNPNEEGRIDIKNFNEALFGAFTIHFDFTENVLEKESSELIDLVKNRILKVYEEKEGLIGDAQLRRIERIVTLQNIDNLWKDHLLSMDHLKDAVGLYGYAQKDPLLIYQKEGFDMFSAMFYRIKENTIEQLFKIQIAKQEESDAAKMAEAREEEVKREYAKREAKLQLGRAVEKKRETIKRDSEKVGRNDPCPCGSGKKYKRCHGK